MISDIFQAGLGLRKFSGKCVPHSLSDSQNTDCANRAGRILDTRWEPAGIHLMVFRQVMSHRLFANNSLTVCFQGRNKVIQGTKAQRNRKTYADDFFTKQHMITLDIPLHDREKHSRMVYQSDSTSPSS
jgi:hypothetical protein